MSDNKHKIIIAIDGFSSCGKSTFAREVAARIGYIFIDTGAMYRAVTLLGLRRGAIGPDGVDEKALTDLLSEADISFRFNPGRGASDIYLDGENVESRIRGIEVSNSVSRVSSIGAVREKLVHLQQQMGKQKGVVMDGRDIGTVVLPNAVDGIVTGCILAVGRIVGESAALLFTAGAAEVIAKGVVKAYTSNGATLSVLLYLRAFEDGDFTSAWGIGAVLLVLVLLINLAARLAKTKLKQKQ